MFSSKKSVALITALLLVFGLCSCKQNTKNEVKNNDPANDVTDEITQNTDNENIDQETYKDTDTEPEEDSTELPSEETKEEEPKPVNPFAGETLESFYSKAAFVGDSVMHGLQLYSARGVTATTNSTFLTLSSFAARHALSDVTEKSYHPTYNGEKMKTEDALSLAGVDKVFISLGLNDVRVTPKTYYENYVEFIGKIKEKCPDIKIFIISTTYPVEEPNPNKMSKSVALEYRDQLHDLNTRLKQYCDENGGYFVDLMSPLMSENGFLTYEYTSDNYVHLTNKAYSVWEQNLINYAQTLIDTGKAPVSFPTFNDYRYVIEEAPEETAEEAPAQEQENTEADSASAEVQDDIQNTEETITEETNEIN